MTFENKNKPTEVRMRAFIRILICATIILLFYVPGLIPGEPFGIEKRNWTWIIIGIYLVLSFKSYIKNYYYILINVGKSYTLIKYYSLRPLSSKRKTIKMPSKELIGVVIDDGFLGFNKKITFYQKVKNKVAVYPPISLTGFNNKEIKEIKRFFKPILKKIKK